MKAEKITPPFHRLTEQEIRQHYKDNLINTTGYLFYIRRITCHPSKKFLIPNIIEFCKHWGIPRPSFYRAVDHLKAKGYMSWEATHGLIFTDSSKVIDFPSSDNKCLTNETPVHLRTDGLTNGQVASEVDNDYHERDTPYIYGSRAHSSDISNKQTLSDSTAEFSAFLAGLVDEREREKFWDFGRKKAANLPEQPELPDRWVAKYHQELYAQFRATEAAATPAANEASQAQQQKLTSRRKQAKEFLSERNTDSDREAKCVPAPQKSAAQPQETVEEPEVSNQLEEGAKEPKIEGKGFGVDQKLIERLKAKSKKSPKQVTKEVVEDDRVNDAAPYD